ncbi:MAG: lytic transglycosylase domain-containing protein, partial [Rhodanobacter sp.]
MPATISVAPQTRGAAETEEVAVTDAWERLRNTFAMSDCQADPAIMAWAKRYTRHPKIFESQLQAVLPRLRYVQQVAEQYEIPGEFVLLPWVESNFRPVTGQRHRPAGMWQIMPITAGAMGLRVDGHYDGRLDVPAATHAVMRLLKQYHEQFQDWRVADYAYNAGEFSIRRIIRTHGMPTDNPVIPQWPVRKVTRDHLVKLLAMACVIREPSRFSVSLPQLPSDQKLVKVAVPHRMSVARAAGHADMSVERLKHFNAAFRNDMIDPDASSYLLLPTSHAQAFREALHQQANSTTAEWPSHTSK